MKRDLARRRPCTLSLDHDHHLGPWTWRALSDEVHQGMGSKPVVLGDGIIGTVGGSRLSVASGKSTTELGREVPRQTRIEGSGDSQHARRMIEPCTHPSFSPLLLRARLSGVGPKHVHDAPEFLTERLRRDPACKIEQVLTHGGKVAASGGLEAEPHLDQGVDVLGRDGALLQKASSHGKTDHDPAATFAATVLGPRTHRNVPGILDGVGG